MPNVIKIDFDKGLPRRIDIELFIKHPTMTPADITAALGLDAQFAHRAGDQRKTPTRALLEGLYSDTRWRHSIRYELKNQWFAENITVLVDRLMNHKEFFSRLRTTGGEAMIIVQFLGDGYFGDNVPMDT
ncbi:MAG TPA: DUF4279 domain-containing protein [Micropepsaceae bacterium]|nr:DUF4279 domain-containing protein [Micropepsaceae bacterium]